MSPACNLGPGSENSNNDIDMSGYGDWNNFKDDDIVVRASGRSIPGRNLGGMIEISSSNLLKVVSCMV